MVKEDSDFDFLGLLTDEINGKTNKYNGAIKLNQNNLFIEKRSRFNGRIKDSYEINCDQLDSQKIERIAVNRIEIDLGDRKLILKTMDHEMLDNFENKLLNRLGIVGGEDFKEENLSNIQVTENIESAFKSQDNLVPLDIPDQIRKYHGLFKDGIITEEEFETKKKELLNK